MTADLCLSVRKLRTLPSVPNIAVVKLRGPERKYFRLENRAGETSTWPHFCWMVAETGKRPKKKGTKDSI